MLTASISWITNPGFLTGWVHHRSWSHAADLYLSARLWSAIDDGVKTLTSPSKCGVLAGAFPCGKTKRDNFPLPPPIYESQTSSISLYLPNTSRLRSWDVTSILASGASSPAAEAILQLGPASLLRRNWLVWDLWERGGGLNKEGRGIRKLKVQAMILESTLNSKIAFKFFACL